MAVSGHDREREDEGRERRADAAPPEPRPASDDARAARKKHLDEKLDEALRDTFPASDPIELTPGPGD